MVRPLSDIFSFSHSINATVSRVREHDSSNLCQLLSIQFFSFSARFIVNSIFSCVCNDFNGRYIKIYFQNVLTHN